MSATGDTVGAPERPEAGSAPAVAEGDPPAPESGRNTARSTVIYAVATGLSRLTGLGREVVAARYFGTSGAMSAFTIAFQVPNLLRALFTDAALQGAFVPVFADLLESGKKREAFALASNLLSLLFLVLGGLITIFLVGATVFVPLIAPGFADDPVLKDLTIGLTRVLLPTVVLFAGSALVAGMLNSLGHFTVPALAPVAWNGIIIIALLATGGVLQGQDHIYLYAFAVVVATIVQFVLPLPWLRTYGVSFRPSFNWRDEQVKRVLKLMLPVTLTLGLFNLSLLIDSLIGTLVSEQAPAAIDRAFRLCVLPQGIFGLAVATIMFPTMARYASRGRFDEMRVTLANGIRYLCLFLIPSSVFLVVLAEPITRLVYQRGAFDAAATHLVAEALAVWGCSLPLQGVGLLLSQAFFSLGRPWVTTIVAVGYVIVNTVVGVALYGPFGVGGVVAGTVVANIGMTISKSLLLRPHLGHLEGRQNLSSLTRMLIAGVALGGVSYAVWWVLDDALGRAFTSQLVAVGVAMTAGSLVYAGAVLVLRVPESRQVGQHLSNLFRRGREPMRDE
ncbi:MAG: putative peptidoglycan lipid flippase [Thermoleophilaceae bacterium]|jgi:putative peptidoglycan lipid II flippase|nr:putative peptidoglycan lipid flippase [Thermoleophilaceae bacterium]